MDQTKDTQNSELVAWVLDHCERWRRHRDENWEDLWREYELLYRGVWEAEMRSRETERSRIISPAMQQAIETRHSEIVEAIFGNSEWFDFEEGKGGQNTANILEVAKNNLRQDAKYDKYRKSVDQATLLAEIYGTGIVEIKVKKEKYIQPAQQDIDGTGRAMVGVAEYERVCVPWDVVHPRNFLIDPNATTIEDALGCAIEKPVAIHKIIKGMEEGIYMEADIGEDAVDDDLQPTIEDVQFKDDSAKLLTYYGKVPRRLLEDQGEEVVELFDENEAAETRYEDLVEAIVVIANDGVLLKAEKSPYMMEDRPVVAFQDETVPGRFWGRGTAEKAYNMQKAIDAQLRLHFDSLALTAVPMMAMDATRMPRGSKFKVHPGATVLTNGNPSEILQPFQFGQTNNDNLATAREMERMLLMATGTVDSAGAPTNTTRDGANGMLDMAAASVIKKYKRTLTNINEDFLVPALKKTLYRKMQFDSERYPAVDVNFVPLSGMGLIAREYEQTALLRMLSTLGPESPIVPILMQKIVKTSSLSDKEEVAAMLEEMTKPNPEQQQMQQMMQMQQMRLVKADADLKEAQVQNTTADALKTMEEAKTVVREAEANIIAALTKNLGVQDEQQRNFENRLALAEVALKEKDQDQNREIVMIQTLAKLNEANSASGMKNMEEVLKGMMADNAEIKKLLKAKKKVIRDDEGNIIGSEPDLET